MRTLSCPCEFPQASDPSRPLYLGTGMWKCTPGTVGGSTCRPLGQCVLRSASCSPLPVTSGARLPDLRLFLCPCPLTRTLSSCLGASSLDGPVLLVAAQQSGGGGASGRVRERTLTWSQGQRRGHIPPEGEQAFHTGEATGVLVGGGGCSGMALGGQGTGPVDKAGTSGAANSLWVTGRDTAPWAGLLVTFQPASPGSWGWESGCWVYDHVMRREILANPLQIDSQDLSSW